MYRAIAFLFGLSACGFQIFHMCNQLNSIQELFKGRFLYEEMKAWPDWQNPAINK